MSDPEARTQSGIVGNFKIHGNNGLDQIVKLLIFDLILILSKT